MLQTELFFGFNNAKMYQKFRFPAEALKKVELNESASTPKCSFFQRLGACTTSSPATPMKKKAFEVPSHASDTVSKQLHHMTEFPVPYRACRWP
jgi:hypothetical protein